MSEGDHDTPLVIDPTDNLTEQLTAARALLDADGSAEGPELSRRLAKLVLELSDWIEHGGSLPDQWQSAAGDAQDDDAEPTIADLDGSFGPGADDAAADAAD